MGEILTKIPIFQMRENFSSLPYALGYLLILIFLYSGILFQYKVLVSQEVQIGETFYTNQILYSTFKFIQTHIEKVTTDMNWELVPNSSSSILKCSFASRVGGYYV